MSERFSAGMSRREFIRRSFALSLTPLLAPPLNILVDPEHTTKHPVNATRQGLDLTFTTYAAPPEVNRYVARLNEASIEAQSDHETPSPDVLEGWYTAFGPSSISDQQMLIVTDELKRRVDNGELSPASMTDQQAILYKIRQTYDDMNLSANIDDPELYKSKYIQMLEMALLPDALTMPIAVAAGRSINDMGRVGFVQTYNRLSESWGPSVLVVVLNTATAQTYWGNINKEMVHGDVTGDYDATMRWAIELSDEALVYTDEKSRVNRRPGVVRYSDTHVPDSIQMRFPTYDRLVEPMTHSWKQMGHTISRALQGKNVQRRLSDLTHARTLPSWEFMVGDVQRIQELQSSNFLPYLLATITPLQVFDGDDQQFMQSLSLQDTTPGIPMGNISLHTFLTHLSVNNALGRKIMSAEPTNTAIFFLENYDETQAILINGIYDQQSKRFISIEDNVVVFRTYAQIVEIQAQSAMNRIVLFS